MAFIEHTLHSWHIFCGSGHAATGKFIVFLDTLRCDAQKIINGIYSYLSEKYCCCDKCYCIKNLNNNN